MNNIAALAVALGEVMKPEFKVYAKQILLNAKRMAQRLMEHGCKLITNGTDNHMMVVDCIRSFNMDGKKVQHILDEIGISTSKSTIPDDPLPPFAPSGLRLGTPAITTRGMKEPEIDALVTFMLKAIEKHEDEAALRKMHAEVIDFCRKYPLPGYRDVGHTSRSNLEQHPVGSLSGH
jgi:glycine hydroxymethyltransferase